MGSLRRLLSLVTSAALAVSGLIVAAPAVQAAEEVYPAPASGSWTVDGRAWGHGRGMSQWGAQGAALQGRSASEILAFYYPGTTVGSVTGQYVNVSLTKFTPTTTVTVWSPENRSIRMGPLNGEVLLGPGRWTVTVSGQTVTAQRRSTAGGPVTETRTYTGTLRFESQNEVGMIIAPGAADTTGRWYRGDLRIVPTSGTGFNVTNSLPMEDYLRSVVPRESPASWAAAALQAQAVAARSYAWHKVTNGNPLCDTTSCQVYYGKGVANAAGSLTESYEDSRTDAAIAATSGRIQMWDGAVAFTEFSSSNGGWTTPSALPYQVSKADPWSGTAPGDNKTRWEAGLSVATVAQSCPGSGGTLRNLVVVSRTGYGDFGGRVTKARVECSTGNATLTSPTFGLLSSWWKPRTSAPKLEGIGVSATVIDHGGQMSIGATPSYGVTWTLTVRDRATGNLALTTTGTAAAGQRFNATWFGTYATAAGSGFVGPGTYTVTLTAVDSSGATTAPFSTAVTVRRPADPAPVAAVPLVANAGYVPVTPTRLLDSRLNFQSLGAGQRADLPVLGRAGIPASGVTAVVLNVTAVNAVSDTHLRVWPAGASMPNASSLNTDASRTQASMVTVGVGGGGKVSFFNAAGTTHYIVDVLGYYTTALASSSRYTPVDPVRAFDSRSSTALSSGDTRTVDVAAALGVAPVSLSTVAVNVTAIGATGPGYVVAYGSGAVPATSTVNLAPGADVANRTLVPVVNGKITLTLRGSQAHVAVDVVGWYAAAGATSGALFTPVQPARLVDSRTTSAFGPQESRTATVTGTPVPSGAKALVGTLTATGQTAPTTHARLWPAGVARPGASDLNSGAGRTQANAVMVRIGTGGGVVLYNDQGSSHLILDAVGYFS